MSLDIWLAYLVTAVVFSFAPGSGTVNSISNGMVYGARKSMASILGLQAGMAVHIVLVGVGLGTLVAQSEMAFAVIKWIGVVYLVWLGVQKWREHGALDLNDVNQNVSSGSLFKRAVFINLTNPKTIVFLVALFPQFIDPALPQLPQLLVLGVTTLVIDMLVMVFYVSLAAKMSRFIRSEKMMSVLNRVFGSMFIGCGALLATARS
ncbi:homoserine/homoserine lactone efflux protein [Vibrio sp. Of7-15]|uniref:homoserine/homoserine lactone efflux protein n=1 Tax=Vibrio sp. Of7-15 TaxID=2724879 RepID=UPI001EF3C3D0|nr:homoserine/homoserine lactone efflux protein [Vibrio sp. Of7-15]MCG7498894.1 homoserine/homoserine lactone efflux protein [Vibrio sp. Of7-15]